MSVDEMHERILDGWNSRIEKRDVVWVVGDVIWSSSGVATFTKLDGIKHIVLGNHDKVRSLLPHVNQIKAYHVYKNKWLLSHAPIHPDSLRGYPNVHGHMHGGTKVDDPRYTNINCELTDYTPLSEEELDALV
jgi:calcineurin-like phosphoesterase family protein